MKRIVIIGGGITGLSAAHRLRERADFAQFQLTLLEAGPRPGGVIQTEDRDGFLLERGPDSFISEKPAALNLIKRIGLESQLIETNENHRRSFIVRSGRLRPLPEGFQLLAPARLWPFVTSDIFSWSGKMRMAFDLILPKRDLNGAADESLAEFVRRRLGREALERVAQPMIGGIYTANPENLSLRAAMPRLVEMERQHRSIILATMKQGRSRHNAETSGARYGLFLSFARGIQTLVDRLSTILPPGVLRLNSAAEPLELESGSGKWIVKTAAESIRADQVCIALPAYKTADLLRRTDSVLADELEAIPYASTATVNLAYQRADISHPLDGFGFVVPFTEKRSLLACSFSSVKFTGRAPKGYALLRAFVGGAMQPELFELEPADMIRLVQKDLHDLLGIDREPLFAEVSKWKRSMPQYEVGHLERVRRIHERLSQLPTLKLAGSAFTGAGIPDCIASGEHAIDSLSESVERSSHVE